MTSQLRISGKNLGAIALADSCERCTWLKIRLKHQMPFSIFPGIFSSIDSYTKYIAHCWFDHHGRAPVWLKGLGNPVRYEEPPHWSKFQMVVKEYNILLTGAPDGVFVLPDGTYLIADYKTARYTASQDNLLPMYEAQLNTYAMIGEEIGYPKVSRIGLIYFEPPISPAETCQDMALHRDDGFLMPFTASLHEVCLDRAILDPLFTTARDLFDRPTCPPGRSGCKDCQKLDALIDAASQIGGGGDSNPEDLLREELQSIIGEDGEIPASELAAFNERCRELGVGWERARAIYDEVREAHGK